MLLALLALVVSQLGAQWHTYRHGAAPRTEVSGSQLQAAQESCKDCLAFAPLLSAADGIAPQQAPAPQPPAEAPGPSSPSCEAERPRLAFRSRAPPADSPA